MSFNLLKYFICGVMLVLSGLISLNPSLANERRLAVRVLSKLDFGEHYVRTGSGISFLYRDNCYVVTSAHVLYHNAMTTDKKVSAQHSVVFNEGDEFLSKAAQLVAVNFANDLGLLRVEGGEKVCYPLNFERLAEQFDINDSDPQQREVVSAYGFRSGAADDELSYAKFDLSILSRKYAINALPLVPFQVLLRGHVEHGLSGGPLTNSEGEIIALISSQFLRQKAGHIPRTTDEKPADSEAEIFHLAIDRSTMSQWIKDVFEKIDSAHLPELISFQSNGISAVDIDDVIYSEYPCADSSAKETVMRDSEAEEVSKNPKGVGGGDAHGVGGNKVTSSSGVCGVQLFAGQGATAKRWPFEKPSWQKEWSSKVKQKINHGCTLKIAHLLDRKDRKIKFESLAKFFALIVNEGARPILRPSECSVEAGQTELELEAARLGAKMQEDLQALRNTLAKIGFDDRRMELQTNLHLLEIESIAEDLSTNNVELLYPKRLGATIAEDAKPSAEVWDLLFTGIESDEVQLRSTALYRALHRCLDLTKQMSLTP